jgi:hypothetical protein
MELYLGYVYSSRCFNIKVKQIDLAPVFRQVLEDMEMLSAFTAILHVPNLSQPDHLIAVLEESDVFSKKDLSTISRKVHGHRYVILKTAQMQH